jgi:uncharacterized phosphosugar-binding protein
MYVEYVDTLCELLQHMKEAQAEAIQKAAVLVADTIIEGGLVYAFGSGHSQCLSREIHSRAGGLYPVVSINDPMWGKAERLEGYGELLLKGLPLKKGEVIFVISNSGRNPSPIDVAMKAKEMGLHVVAVTSLPHSKSQASRHSSGKRLYEVADIVLDTGVPVGDACMSFEGMPIKAGPASTALGASILNAVMVEAIQYILDKGAEPPVLISANVEGGDEHNRRVVERYGHLATSMGLFTKI